MRDIDDIISDDDEEKGSREPKPKAWEGEKEKETEPDFDITQKKVLVGEVEHFYEKISVVTIKLIAHLKVGDLIEIENEEDPVNIIVSSIQINKENVEEASEGDDIGIKVDRQVKTGSKVYITG